MAASLFVLMIYNERLRSGNRPGGSGHRCPRRAGYCCALTAEELLKKSGPLRPCNGGSASLGYKPLPAPVKLQKQPSSERLPE